MPALAEELQQLHNLFMDVHDELLDLFSEASVPETYPIHEEYDSSWNLESGTTLTFPDPGYWAPELPDENDEHAEESSETAPETDNEMKQQAHTTVAYYGGVVIRKIPRYTLGHNILGRAFPYAGIIEIAADLYGQEFEEVKTHEMLHIKYPRASELSIRSMTKALLPFTPRFH